MKKVLLAATLGTALFVTGCQAPYSQGLAFNNYSAPVAVLENDTACSKRGQATMVNFLGLVGLGDASLEAAKEDGGVTLVGTVDVQYNSILGIIGNTTTTVCGE